jgi:hypothetical protein
MIIANRINFPHTMTRRGGIPRQDKDLPCEVRASVSEDTPRESCLVSCTFNQNVPPRTLEKDERDPPMDPPLYDWGIRIPRLYEYLKPLVFGITLI